MWVPGEESCSVGEFLSLMEHLDRKMNPKREGPYGLLSTIFLRLLRVWRSFEGCAVTLEVLLYEGGVIGEES
jgi:hypothetical protein